MIDIRIVLILILVLVIIGVIVAIYYYKEDVLRYGFSIDLEKTKKELTDICDAEKVSIQEAADKLVQQKLDEKNKEIEEARKMLSEEYSQKEKTHEIATSELQTVIDKCKADLNTELENVAIAKKELEDKEKTISDLKLEVAKKINVPTPWVCGVNGINAPIRVNSNKDIECMSKNNWDCLWSTDVPSCNTAIQNNKDTAVKPNICSATAYADQNHWCNKGSAAFGLEK
ncbi:MAG: hypothetical protein RLZZ546_398 [Bacteroidota bacterium]|jgi:aspartyl-tRNA synthetase